MLRNIIHIGKVEWMKIKQYPAWWILIGIVALSYPATIVAAHSVYANATEGTSDAKMIAKMILGNPFSFPNAWQTIAYFSSYFVLLPAILVIMLITNEFQYKTHRQNVIDGWSRKQFITGKLIDVFIITLWVTLIYFLVALYFGATNSNGNWHDAWKEFYFVGLFFIQTFSQLTIAFLLGFLLKRAFMAMAFLVFYYMVLENILVGVAKWKLNDLGRFLPFEVSDRMIPAPGFFSKFSDDMKNSYELTLEKIPEHTFFTIFIILAIWLICFRIFSRKDL
jgi:ABC-type transport system involved in multi-copper enzyme maturation permease subunit